ncbi:trigger factor [Aurantivibrio infirmus]
MKTVRKRMQVSVETTSGLERKLTVGVPAEQVDGEVAKRLQDAAGKVKINGFRSGKVPLKVVKQRLGDGIRQEVLGDVINRTYFEALQKEDIKPAGLPTIDTTTNVEGKDLEFVAIFEVYPEIDLVDLSTLAVEKPLAEIEEKDIDTMIENLRTQQATWEDLDRAAKEGDQVTIDYLGTKDGEEFAGGKAEGQKLELGSNSMIPGFESGIVGMKAGDEKTLSLSFPDDYHAEELKGAAVEFAIKLHSVAEKKLPEIDEEFFKKFGVEENNLEAFRNEVKSNMERELANAKKMSIKTQVLDALFESQKVELPKALISNEIDNMRKQMMQQFGDAAKSMDMTQLLPDTMFEEQATKRVSLGLIINEIISAQEIKPEDDRVKKAIAEIAATYDQPEDVIRYYTSNQEAKANVEAMVLEEQVIDYILAGAKVTEKQTDYQALMESQKGQ